MTLIAPAHGHCHGTGSALAPTTGRRAVRHYDAENKIWMVSMAEDREPKPAPPPVPTMELDEIPAGDPAEVAAALLGRLRPGAPEETKSRLDAINATIAGSLERARTGPVKLRDFVAELVKPVTLRGVLLARLAAMGDEDAPSTGDPATEVAEAVQRVKRFREGRELRDLWIHRAGEARAVLARIEGDIRAWIAVAASVHPSDPNRPRHRLGLYLASDVWADRMEGLLRSRGEALERLERLGVSDPDGRRRAIAEAIEDAGRDKVCRAIAGAMTVAPPADHTARIGQLTAELGSMDEESQAAAIVRENLVALQAEQAGAKADHKARQRAAAEALVTRAEADDVIAVGELADLVRGEFPNLADQLDELRGAEHELAAVVAELVAEAEARLATGK